MRYFVPDIRLAQELPAQSRFEDKLGGLPWGLPAKMWPICKDCGKSQSLLAQFEHSPERMDLGRTGRVLNVFQCNHDPGMCSTWEGGSGANACFVLEPEDLTASLTAAPSDDPPLEREARVVQWIERDDGIGPLETSAYFSGEKYFAMDHSQHEKATMSTRLGGVPFWIQSPDEAPAGEWQFIGQLDSSYSFITPPQTASLIPEDQERWEGRTHVLDGPNFGDGGIAYLFVRGQRTKPEGWFFWQCT